jgi:hypothetical protein
MFAGFVKKTRANIFVNGDDESKVAVISELQGGKACI